MTESGPDEATEAIAAIPGWYGKLPGLGDFARRRLPPEFINARDGWLQTMLQAVQDTVGEGWLTHRALPGEASSSNLAPLQPPTAEPIESHTASGPARSVAARADDPASGW